jgi:hypothetical protein
VLLKTKDLVLEIFISNVIILLNYFATLAGSLTTTPNHQHKVDNEVSLSEGSQGYNYHQTC